MNEHINQNEEQERVNLAIEKNDIGIWEWDLESNEVIWDEQMEKIYALNTGDFKGTIANFKTHIHEEDVFILEEALKLAITKFIPFEIEYRIALPEDTIFILNKARVIVNNLKEPIKIVGVCQDISYRKKIEIDMMSSIINAQEKERTRLGRELHDGVGQLLSAIKLNLNVLALDFKEDISKIDTVDDLKEIIDKAIDEVRNISHNLVPQSLEEFGLALAVENMCNTMNYRQKSEVIYDIFQLNNIRFNSIIELNYYRIAQEMLQNAIKHSQATEIYLLLEYANEKLSLEVRDNGQGIQDIDKAQNKGIGLNNIISRINYLNGTVEFDSVLGKGTSIKVECVPELMENIL